MTTQLSNAKRLAATLFGKRGPLAAGDTAAHTDGANRLPQQPMGGAKAVSTFSTGLVFVTFIGIIVAAVMAFTWARKAGDHATYRHYERL